MTGFLNRSTGSAVGTTLGLLPLVALSATMATPVFAQQATLGGLPVQLDEVVVEGEGNDDPKTSLKVSEGASNKLTAPLVDTPRTVQVITQRQMEERGAVTVYDVLRTTPGVSLGTGEGGNPMGDRPFIRGYEASTDMFVDGVRSLGRTTYEAFNLESIEIIKGPGGAYSGRGATGGSLNMVTKKAHIGENFHEFSGLIGTDNQYRGTYDGNMSAGNFAARLNLMAQDSEVPGRDGVKDDKVGIAGSFVAQLSEQTKVTAGLYHSKADGTPDFGIPMANAAYLAAHGGGYGTGSQSDPYLPIGNANHNRFFGLFNRDFREVTNQTATLKLEHEFNDRLRFDSTVAWIGTEQAYIVTRPTFEATAGGVLQRAARSGQRKNRTLAWQSNLSGEFDTGRIEHSFVLGFETSREKLQSGNLTGFPSGTAAFNTPNFLNPDPWVSVDMSGLTYDAFGAPTVTDNTSIYAFDTIKFNEQWLLNLGIRYENFEVDSGTLTRKDDIFSYQAGIVYKPLPNGSIYASFGTSANPSGQCAAQAGGSEGASACTLTAGNVDLEPEKNRSYEVGTKWDLFDDRLSVTAALFRTEKTNQRATDPITNTVQLVGNSRVDGVELAAAGNITDAWAVSAGYTYMDATLLSDGTGANAGNQLHYIAPHSFSLWTTYAVTEQTTVGGGATFTDQRYMNAANTSALPSQWRVDLMAAHKFNDHASLQLNVNNVFNEKLYDASHVGIFANTGPGRNGTLKLNVRF